MNPSPYDSRYITGVEYFNRQAYFEAHEIWESVWKEERGPAKDFYKGLIQVAVCLLHFVRGNTRGARKLCVSSRRYLEEYRPSYRGVDVDRLLEEMQRCCAELLASDEEVPRLKVEPSLLPELELGL